MEPELFDALSALEMRDERERMRGIAGTERINILEPDSAKYVSIIAISKKAQNMVEVGSGAGYSTLWLAYAASVTGGKLVTCEIDPAKAEKVKSNLAEAGLADFVEVLSGDARETLRGQVEPVDLLMIDADFGQYETYFDVVYKRMGVGSVVIANNVVAAENELADYVTYVQNHPNLESVTIPLGQGLEFSVKIAD